MTWHFRPSLWPTLGTVFGCALFLTAGYWQLSRGLAKQQLLSQYDTAASHPPLQLGADSAALARAEPQTATVQGEYLAERQLLLDDQVLNGRPGYNVWTPLQLADGALLIVNRGWLPQTGIRSDLPQLPAPQGPQSLSGYWRALPRPAMRLGAGECDKTSAPAKASAAAAAIEHPPASLATASAAWPRIVDYPTIEDLQCLFQTRVIAGELLLAADAPGGFAREWRALPAEMPPSRHYGYAAQWFAFAATLFALFIKLNLKRRP